MVYGGILLPATYPFSYVENILLKCHLFSYCTVKILSVFYFPDNN